MAVRFNPRPPLSPDHFSCCVCPDQFIGTINNTGTTHKHNNPAQTKDFGLSRMEAWIPNIRINVHQGTGPYTSNYQFKNKVIVVLVESPHIYEFSRNNLLNFDGPIMGATGDRFNSHFLEAVDRSASIAKNACYDVVIVNAVQHQCSKGLSLKSKKERNHEFKTIINDTNPYNGLDDLIYRLDVIKPDYVINCVTYYLKNRFISNQTLRMNLQHPARLLSGTHPSAWNKNTIFQ